MMPLLTICMPAYVHDTTDVRLETSRDPQENPQPYAQEGSYPVRGLVMLANNAEIETGVAVSFPS